ncbi:MAG: hypothetical protein GX103_10190 [Bacteroidales bacterium]|nr:hypothetical protein [Bacteroidales bacterium]
MISTKKILLSVAVFIVLYTLLLLPQLKINRLYAEYFCSVGNFLFEDFPRGGFVNLKTQTEKGGNDIALFLSRADWMEGTKIKGVTANKASDRIGYLITAFFVALTLATPISWKRKLIAVVVGIVIVTTFVMLKMYIIILNSYTLVDWFGLYQEPTEKARIQFWYEHFAASATYGYSFVVVVWLALVLRKKDWKLLIASFRKKVPA